MTDTTKQLVRLEEIREEMLDLLREAASLVAGTNEEDPAEAYWIPHIKVALGSDSYPTHATTMRDTIRSLDGSCQDCGGEVGDPDNSLCDECNAEYEARCERDEVAS